MSGLGRRSHYRKHLTDAVLFDLVEPNEEEGECIAKIVGTRGGNQFEIILPTSRACCNTKGTKDKANNVQNVHLAILPSRFHKLVWVKRGDFVIVSCAQNYLKQKNNSIIGGVANSDIYVSNGIRYIMSHILYPEQIKNLKKKGLWPYDSHFSLTCNQLSHRFMTGEEYKEETNQSAIERGNACVNNTVKNFVFVSTPDRDKSFCNDGIVYGDYEVDDQYFVNYNKIARLEIVDSSSEGEYQN